jgi:hypothetical protein
MYHLARLSAVTDVFKEPTKENSYLAHYATDTVTLLDHYRYLSQLLPIYAALEERMQQPNFFIKIPDQFTDMHNRSQRIKNDLAYLEKYIPAPERERGRIILDSTRQYVSCIQGKKTDIFQQIEVFGYFLARVIADVWMGATTKNLIEKLYRKEKIFSSEKGIENYSYTRKMLRQFADWVNSQKLNESGLAILIESVNVSLNKMEFIFQDLDRSRTSAFAVMDEKNIKVESKKSAEIPLGSDSKEPSVAYSAMQFFTKKNAAVAVGTLLTGAALVTQFLL